MLAGVALLRGLRREEVLRAVASALVGSTSHVALDAFTHEHGWVVERVAFLRGVAFSALGRDVRVYKLLQHGGTVVLSLATVAMLVCMPAIEWPRVPWKKLLLGILAGALVGAAWGFLEHRGEEPLRLLVCTWLRSTSIAVVAGYLASRPHRPGAIP